MSRIYSEEEKSEYLEAYHKSGKSKTEFSRENNIHSFRLFSTGESKNHGISLLRGSDRGGPACAAGTRQM